MILTYDIGSTSCKVCLYELDGVLKLKASETEEYGMKELPNGGVEQDPDEWWQSMAVATRRMMKKALIDSAAIEGIAFCAQMQGLVLVGSNLQALRPAMSYMDQRSGEQRSRILERGIRVEGMNLGILVRSLIINGAVAASVKDPVWKYKWVEEHEPDIFSRIHKWLDVKDYLIARATGCCTMTEDSAFATFLTDQRRVEPTWSSALLGVYGVRPEHMPDIISSSDQAGVLLSAPAEELGLKAGTPIFGGGGDASMIAVGAGSSDPGDTYVYTGTSGWVSAAVTKKKVDVARRIASIVGARSGVYNFFGEQETAGKCLEWVRDHLALDEIDIFLDKHDVASDPESEFRSLYDFLIDTISTVPPGSGGVLFAPWLHGNRAPFEDENARGMFFNIGLGTGKRKLIRAVVEGIIYHQKWLLESIERHFDVSLPIRFAGGGALSSTVAQIMADILEKPVETIKDPQNAGAAGAALAAVIGLGLIPGFGESKKYVPVDRVYEPDEHHFAVYRRQYAAFCMLYPANRRIFQLLNGR